MKKKLTIISVSFLLLAIVFFGLVFAQSDDSQSGNSSAVSSESLSSVQAVSQTNEPEKITAGRGMLSILKNGRVIIRDSYVESVDLKTHIMKVKVWGIEIEVLYGKAAVIPPITKNYRCLRMDLETCEKSSNFSFFKEGDRANITGIVKDASRYPILVEAKRVYNPLYEKVVPSQVLKRRFLKKMPRVAPFKPNGKIFSPLTPKNLRKDTSKENILRKIDEILKEIERIKAQVFSGQTSSPQAE